MRGPGCFFGAHRRTQMNPCFRNRARGAQRLFFFLLLVSVVPEFLRANAQQMSAIYRHGSLLVTIPYHGAQAGTGKLTTELLDPENDVLGRVEHTVVVETGDGKWQESVAPQKAMDFESVLWQRIRYRFVNDDAKQPMLEGIDAVSQVLRRPVVHVLGQKEYMAGSRAAIRVMVAD